MKNKIYAGLNGYLVFALLLFCFSCKKEVQDVPGPVLSDEKEITSFVFEAAKNPQYLVNDVHLEIQGDKIVGRVPFFSDISQLVATYETTGQSIKMGGVVQQSGRDTNNFRQNLLYTVLAEDGSSRNYEVSLTNFTGLPCVFITTENKTAITSKVDYVQGKMSIYATQQYLNQDYNGEIEIRGRGNTTWASFPKKPYKIKLKSKESLLGMPAEKDWVLLANYTDKSLLRNALAFDIGRRLQMDYVTKSAFVEVFLNEMYVGTYQLAEQLEEGSDRVDVKDGGYLVEVDQLSRLDKGDVYFHTKRLSGARVVNIKYPDSDDITEAQQKEIASYVENAEDVLYSDSFLDPENGYRKYLDVKSFADWYIVNELLRNNDAIFFSSVYMHKKKDGKLVMGPLWDFDLSTGNINYNENDNPEGWWIRKSVWIARLFEDPYFRNLLKERWAFLMKDKSQIFSFINGSSNYLGLSEIENHNKWNTLYNYTWPNGFVFGSYQNEVQHMKDWLSKRIAWMNTEIQNMQ
ncbi:MAG TPA: CotH kinase family protein [Parafilimonas sp.]|nr:CotH kinase family protein [Parafilimonas sp.]